MLVQVQPTNRNDEIGVVQARHPGGPFNFRIGDNMTRTGCPSRSMLKAMTSRSVPRSLKWFAAALIVTVSGLAGWQFLIVGPGDPRDLRYEAWKLGVYPLRIDYAVGMMIEDPRRDSVVIGKTKEQLVSRFGFVSSTPGNDYVRYCYDNSPYRGKSLLFIRNSNWMVLMKDGVANGLVLAKGC
jgi:hypothetical protein